MVKCFTLKGGKSAGKVVCQGSKGARKNYDDSKVKISSRKGTQPKKPRELRTARAKLTKAELKGVLRNNGYTERQLEGKTKAELLRLPPTKRLKTIQDKERTAKAMSVSKSRFKETTQDQRGRAFINRKIAQRKSERAKLSITELKALLRKNGYTARQLEGKTKEQLIKLPKKKLRRLKRPK